MKKIREWISISSIRAPGLMVILGILAANAAFVVIAALTIMGTAPPTLESADFWSCVYYAVTMLLSGYMEVVIEDIGQTRAYFVLFCMLIVIIGMVVFTGAIIGYMSELISSFIENADSSSRKLRISNHVVILNWNTRASELVNELLYNNKKDKVVILVDDDKDDVLANIDERLSDTIETEGLRNRLTIIVREGDSWSTKQLDGISITAARSVIILCDDNAFLDAESGRLKMGNAHTIKTLLQVAQMVAEENPENGPRIIVETEDDWTFEMVETIIRQKAQAGTGNIVPVAVNRVLGQVFSQFCIMPQLNTVYSALLSNKDISFFSLPADDESMGEDEFVASHLACHLKSIPLTVMECSDGRLHRFYMSNDERHIMAGEPVPQGGSLQVSINPEYVMRDKHVLILGHNSKSFAIMDGFEAFGEEWKKQDGSDIMNIIVIDDDADLERMDYYREYPFVKRTVAAEIYERDLIRDVLEEFIDAHGGEGYIMILSDDTVGAEEIDDDALTFLILVQDIIHNKSRNEPDWKGICLIVEILNPCNYDIANNYSADNIVISNRYISRILMQIGEKDSLFDFYSEILTYDEEGAEEFCSKELYIKKASEFFLEVPDACSAADLIRSVYQYSPDDNKSIMLGYFNVGGEMTLFKGDQSRIRVELSGDDQLILFSNH